jgi:NAD(P)-dependent dehydrogenase (short-subunit alcohol dehydrogenase family)
MNKLKNKVAIVTGASKGIGAAIATHQVKKMLIKW